MLIITFSASLIYTPLSNPYNHSMAHIPGSFDRSELSRILMRNRTDSTEIIVHVLADIRGFKDQDRSSKTSVPHQQHISHGQPIRAQHSSHPYTVRVGHSQMMSPMMSQQPSQHSDKRSVQRTVW